MRIKLDIKPNPQFLPTEILKEIRVQKVIKRFPKSTSNIPGISQGTLQFIRESKKGIINPLLAPTDFIVSEVGDALVATWTASEEAEGYNVYYKLEAESEYTKATASPITETEYTFDLDPGTYDAYVTATRTLFGNFRESEPSNTDQFEIAVDPLENISNIYFSIVGESSGRVYRSPVDNFSYTEGEFFCRNAESGPVRSVSVDTVNRRVACTAGSSYPRARHYDMDSSPLGTMSRGATPGSWNSSCVTIPEYDGYAITNTFEAVYIWSYTNSNDNFDLFSSRQGRPNRMAFDWDEDIMVVCVTSETSRMLVWDISQSTENNGIELIDSYSPGIVEIDTINNKIYYRSSDALSIRRMNYDGTEDENFYTHDETLLDFQWVKGAPEFIFFLTETGLYGVSIDDNTEIEHLIEDTTLRYFDLEYIV